MKICLRSGLCALAFLALAGCASGGGVASYPAERDINRASEQNGIDSEYVSMIERYGRRNGAYIQWINPPRDRALAGGPE